MPHINTTLFTTTSMDNRTVAFFAIAAAAVALALLKQRVMAVVALAILAVAIMLPNAANKAVNNVLRQYKRPATTPPQNDDANLDCARETIAQDGIESVRRQDEREYDRNAQFRSNTVPSVDARQSFTNGMNSIVFA